MLSRAERYVNISASLKHHVGTLVHPAARMTASDFERHRSFIGSRLALSLGALLMTPPCLALADAPAWWEAGALGWFILPFAASVLVSRTGRLAAGEVVGMFAWVGLALTIVLGSGSGAGLAFLLIVPFEAALCTGSSSSACRSMVVAGSLAAGALATWLMLHGSRPFGGGRFLIGLVFLAAVYAALSSFAASGSRRRQHRREADRDSRLRLFMELSDDVFLVFGRSGGVIEAGPGTERMFAITPRDLSGQGLFERIHVADRPLFLKLVTDAVEGGQSCAGTYRFRTGRTLGSDRGTFAEPVFAFVELRVIRVPSEIGEDGHPSGATAIGFMRDVTERKNQDLALEDARAAARRTEAARDLFLANVSHELRTPLNAIIGFSEILATEALLPDDAAKQREYAGIIQQSGQHLLAMVNTILDASKIEAGTFDVFPETFDLAALIKGCVDMVGLKAQQARVDLVRDVTATLGEIVADQRACTQIILNLLSNGIKFTPKAGRVTISARPDGNSVLIVVSDTGIGIGARDLARVGDPFFQAREGYDRDRDGTGLGLSVVRGLVGLHGGTIALESAPGQGTRVTVRLPVDCRRTSVRPLPATKIETIPRYSSLAPYGGAADASKVHKLA